MHWIVKFALVCAGLIVLGLVGVWALEGFASLNVEGHVAVAMFLGIFFTILVSVVLMGLIFYSHRAGYDEAAQPEAERRDSAKPERNVGIPGQ
jgi:hypothetical protein